MIKEAQRMGILVILECDWCHGHFSAPPYLQAKVKCCPYCCTLSDVSYVGSGRKRSEPSS